MLPLQPRLLANAAAAAALAAALACAGCQGGQTTGVARVYTGGSARRGRSVIERYRCGACHLIPGVPHARGMVGPPLIEFGRRTMIAGELPNTPHNLERWLRSPKAVEPGTAMPALGLSHQQRRDVAAYLYTLR